MAVVVVPDSVTLSERACGRGIDVQKVLDRISRAEHEPGIREIARIALHSPECLKLAVCCSGQEVLEKSHDFDAALILLDVTMPIMDGIEPCRHIASDLPGLAEQVRAILHNRY